MDNNMKKRWISLYVENQVVDKHAKLIHVKEIISSPDRPGYVKRNDTL